MYKYQRIEAEKKEREKNSYYVRPVIPPKVGEKQYVALMGSMSHTYGNAVAFMQNWIINLFPEDMFKTIHVNSKIAHRQIKSTSHEFLKKVKPMIIFRPRIGDVDDDRFLRGTPLIERQSDIYSTWGGTNLQPFFEDRKHDVTIKYQMNRSILNMDVIIVLSTLMQQIDYMHYIQNAVRINHPFNLQTCFESFIPQDMLKIVSDIVDIPMYDANGSTKEFLTYMEQNSDNPITYKLQGSSGTREFYRYYPALVDTIITNLSSDEGERVGHVMDQYQITFSVRMEFFTTGFYYIFSDKVRDIKLPDVHPENSTIIPVFTDVLTKEDLNLRPGWHIYEAGSYRLEKPFDDVCIDEMLNKSIRAALQYHRDNGLPFVEFLDIKIRKQGKLIHEGKDYTIDYNTMTVYFKDQNMFDTYRIMVCVNTEYINDLIKTVYKLE